MPAARSLGRFLMLLVVAAVTLPVMSAPASAAAGDLDPNFSNDGIVTTPVGPASDQIEGLAIGPDGRIVVAGSSSNGTDNDFAVARYLTSGALDTTFSGDGMLATPVGLGSDGARAVAIQSDGRIVAAGSASDSGPERVLGGGGTSDLAVVRYTPSGGLDQTFGSGGRVRTSIGPSTDEAADVALQPDGRIIVAGLTFSTSFDFALVRYTSAGVLDTTFGGGDGIVTTPIGTSTDQATSMALQSDGKIVVAGFAVIGTTFDVAVVRYTSTGVLDTTFGGGDGIVTTPIGTTTDEALGVALQSDGKIVAAGLSSNASNFDVALVRYTSTGVLDTTFGGGDGIVTTPIGTGSDQANDVAIQSDGRIVVAGTTFAANTDFAVLRYTSSGNLETTFGGGDGIVTTAVGPSSDFANSLAIQDDGNIVAAGSSSTPSSDFALARYLGGPTISVSDVTVSEVDSGTINATFTLTLSEPGTQNIFVDFATADGTAKSGSDYQSRSGTRLFLVGQRTKRVAITINGDTLQEGTESFFLRLVDSESASIADGEGVGTILDNDLPSASINDVSQTEVNSGSTKTYAFKITLDKAGTNSITINYATADGTAVAPGDYTAKSGSVTFTPGQLSKTVSVIVKGDNAVEPNETFFLNISTTSPFVVITDSQGVGTIANND